MRALILVLALVAIGLSVSILLEGPPPEPEAPVFRPGLLISDEQRGARAEYADGQGNRILYHVESTIPGGPENPPSLRIRREVRDATGRLLSTTSYDHFPTIHFLFPLVAPEDSQGYDRVWVWQRIRREEIEYRGKRRMAWRIDGVDPALPPDQDSVVGWFDVDLPVFGLIRWQRGGRTWSLVGTGS